MSMTAVPGLPPHVADEVEDLSLDRHVEGGGRLVGDEELRTEGEGDRDHDPLAHAAAELVGVALEALTRVRDADELEHLDGPLLGGLVLDLFMGEDRLDELFADRDDRVERGHRVLEDHGDLAAAQVPHLIVGQLDEVDAAEEDLAAGDPAGRLRQETQQGQRGHALAAARLADDTERLVRRHIEAHAVDGMDEAGRGGELDPQVTDGEEGVAGRRGRRDEIRDDLGHRLSRGSSASRRPSPRRLNPSTARMMAMPGKSAVKAAPEVR